MLAGMIAEPAFLSEYTIFALDHSKRPKTAQVASVVSLSSLPVSPSSSFSSSSSSCPVPSSRLCASGESIEDCGPSRDSLFPALCLLFPLDLATRRHLISRLTLLLMGVMVYNVWDRGLSAFCRMLVYCLTSQLLLSVTELNSALLCVGIACFIDPQYLVMLPDSLCTFSPKVCLFEELTFSFCKLWQGFFQQFKC